MNDVDLASGREQL